MAQPEDSNLFDAYSFSYSRYTAEELRPRAHARSWETIDQERLRAFWVKLVPGPELIAEYQELLGLAEPEQGGSDFALAAATDFADLSPELSLRGLHTFLEEIAYYIYRLEDRPASAVRMDRMHSREALHAYWSWTGLDFDAMPDWPTGTVAESPSTPQE